MTRKMAKENTQAETTKDRLLYETAVNVKNISERLFGGSGQPEGGALNYIMEQHKELARTIENNKKELLEKIEGVARQTATDLKVIVEKTDRDIKAGDDKNSEAVKEVSEKQEATDKKADRIITIGGTVNSIALLVVAFGKAFWTKIFGA